MMRQKQASLTGDFSPGVPIFRSFDEKSARDFYIDYLGFQVEWEHRFHEGAPLYMQLRLGDAVLHVSEHHGDATPGSAVRIEVADLESFHNRLAGKDYKFANPGIVEQSWGCREVMLTDPFGNRLVFYDEMAARQAAGSAK